MFLFLFFLFHDLDLDLSIFFFFLLGLQNLVYLVVFVYITSLTLKLMPNKKSENSSKCDNNFHFY